ncbi:MAG: molybdopterin oxidoreductase family protein, partial [Saezia sp.]
GDVKVDWEIISLLSTAMGYPMEYKNTQEIWDEMRELCPSYTGVTYEKLDANGGLGYVQWPCPTEESQGTQFLFRQADGSVKFPTPSGKGQLFTCDWVAPVEKLSKEYPLILSTVREVGHYSCRSMTGNCSALVALADEPGYVQMNIDDARALDIKDQDLVWVESMHGKVITRAAVSGRTNKGAIYMTYQWWIGACNELVGEVLSPITKTPEYKFVPSRVVKIEDQAWAEGYVVDEYSKLKARMQEAVAAGAAE